MKGLAYTPFALLASTIIIGLALAPGTTHKHAGPINEDYTNSIQHAYTQTQSNYALKALQKTASKTQTTEITNPLQKIEELTVKGTTQQLTQTHNLKNWTKSINNQKPGITLENNLTEITIQNLTINTESTLKIQTNSFQKNQKIQTAQTIQNVTDTLLSANGYTTKIRKCSHNKLATFTGTGTNHNGTARGTSILEPENINTRTNKETEIIITPDITNYDPINTQNYAGYITANTPSDPANYNNNYVTGLNLETNTQNIIIHEGAWLSNFNKTTNCYLTSNLQKTPSINERIQNQTRGQKTGNGIFTILHPNQVTNNPTKSNIGYERINQTSLNMVEIEGISTGKGITWQDFRISNEIAIEQNLSPLVK